MRLVIWFVLLFVVAVVAALTLGDNDGLVTFYWGGWRADLSLNFFLLAAFGIGFVVVSVVRAVNTMVGMPARAREWRALRLERATHATLREALSEYFSGRYSRAQRSAQRALAMRQDVQALATDRSFQVLATLLAAGSLHRLQDRTRRDALLHQALAPAGRTPAGPLDEGVRMLAAEWALDDRDGERAESLLAELPPGAARRTQALRLKLQAARLLRRPQQALQTARLLANHQGFSALAAQGMLRALAFESLDAAHDADQLRRAWQQLGAPDQRDAIVVARAARRAHVLGAAHEGRQWLRPLWEHIETLDRDARTELALALAEVSADIGTDWLPRVEAAQRALPSESAVQAAAGAVYAHCRLWGKALRPLEQAAHDPQLNAVTRRHAWRHLAQLAREEGDEARAGECDRAAAAID